MAHEPKKRHSKAAKRTRRASITLEAISLLRCPNCGEPTQSHIACRNCGSYAGKIATQVKEKVQITRA